MSAIVTHMCCFCVKFIIQHNSRYEPRFVKMEGLERNYFGFKFFFYKIELCTNFMFKLRFRFCLFIFWLTLLILKLEFCVFSRTHTRPSPIVKVQGVFGCLSVINYMDCCKSSIFRVHQFFADFADFSKTAKNWCREH